MNVQSPQFIINPYAFYAAKRAQNPIFQRSEFEWTLTGFDAMSAFLANPAAGRGNIGQAPVPFGDTSALEEIKKQNLSLQILDSWMLFQNPPRHTATRRRIADIFTLKFVAQLENSMRECLRQMFAQLSESGAQEIDFIHSIAGPFPLHIICKMLGIPSTNQETFIEAGNRFTRAVEADFTRISNRDLHTLNNTAQNLMAYFAEVVEQRRDGSEDNLIKRFLDAEGDDFKLQELLANCIALLFAGQETSTSQSANAVFSLLSNPRTWQRLVAHPELIDNAVEECLRFDPAVQMIGRMALEDIQLEDVTIKRGDHVFCFLGAAGRDPNINPEPDRFAVDRIKPRHLAFARGAHHCLGASLARLELKVLLEELTQNFPKLALAGAATRRCTWVIRGFDRMPVRLR